MIAANAGQHQVLTGGAARCSGAAAFASSVRVVRVAITCSASAAVGAGGGLSGCAPNTPNAPKPRPAPDPRRFCRSARNWAAICLRREECTAQE